MVQNSSNSTMQHIDELLQKINTSSAPKETKEIFKLFLALFSTIKNERSTTISTLQERVAALEAEAESNRTHCDNAIRTLQEKVNTLEENLKAQEEARKKEVAQLKTDVDANDQYERRDTLILSGPNLPISSPNENCKEIVKNLLRSHTNLSLNDDDISIAHRIGQKPVNNQDKRNIIFKLCRRDLVTDIFDACKQSRPPFYINCSLTPTRNKIFFALRRYKRRFPDVVKGCRVQKGDVIVFLARHAGASSSRSSDGNNRRDTKITINTREDLSDFAINVLNTNLDELNITW